MAIVYYKEARHRTSISLVLTRPKSGRAVQLNRCAPQKMRDEMETDRLLLKKLTYNDLNGLNDFFSDVEATKYLQGIKSLDEIKDWLSLVFQSYEQDGFGPLAIISKEGNQFLGYCGLYLQNDVDGKDEIEILYGLIKLYRM